MKKYLLILVVVIFGCVACTHKREGEIIKTEDGRFYKLDDAPANEAYFLIEIDTASINKLSK